MKQVKTADTVDRIAFAATQVHILGNYRRTKIY